MSRASRQHVFAFRSRGGARLGAGRKPAGLTPGVPHRARPVHDRRHPVHVTVRAVRGLPSLRAHRIFRAIRGGLACSSGAHFRIVHFTVQTNHLHLLVEADGTPALSCGMQGLGIRLAKAINRRIGRAGRVWSDRFHCRALRTPREVRNGLIYVLLNGRKHHVTGRGIDPCSAARGRGSEGGAIRQQLLARRRQCGRRRPGCFASAGGAAGRSESTTHPPARDRIRVRIAQGTRNREAAALVIIRAVLAGILVLSLSLPTRAADPLHDALDRLQKRYESTHTLTADFKQTV